MEIVDIDSLCVNNNRVNYAPYRKEVKEFLDSDGDAAKVWMDERKSVICNQNRYANAIRSLYRYPVPCKAVVRKGQVYLLRAR